MMTFYLIMMIFVSSGQIFYLVQAIFYLVMAIFAQHGDFFLVLVQYKLSWRH